ncbi:MAG: glycosyltransferase family 9 protein, partial [Dehalococcoidia bacterium]
MSMLPEPWKDAQRIAVIRLDNIGDVVMTSPVLRALKACLPQASITLVASPAGSQVAPLLPWVDDVLVVRALWQDASGAMPMEPERELQLIEA